MFLLARVPYVRPPPPLPALSSDAFLRALIGPLASPFMLSLVRSFRFSCSRWSALSASEMLYFVRLLRSVLHPLGFSLASPLRALIGPLALLVRALIGRIASPPLCSPLIRSIRSFVLSLFCRLGTSLTPSPTRARETRTPSSPSSGITPPRQ